MVFSIGSIAFLVAYGELAIGRALVLGFLVRTASARGWLYMLALCFVALVISRTGKVPSVTASGSHEHRADCSETHEIRRYC